MSETGIPASPVQPVAYAGNNLRDGQPVRVTAVTGALAQLPQTVRVDGTVTASTPDGTVTIHTDYGDVTLQLRGPGPLPAAGEPITFDLAGGAPPRAAILRPDQAAPAAVETAPLLSETLHAPLAPPAPARLAQAAPILNPALTADAARQGQQAAAPALPPAQSPLLPGIVVRLLPLSPDAALIPEAPPTPAALGNLKTPPLPQPIASQTVTTPALVKPAIAAPPSAIVKQAAAPASPPLDSKRAVALAAAKRLFSLSPPDKAGATPARIAAAKTPSAPARLSSSPALAAAPKPAIPPPPAAPVAAPLRDVEIVTIEAPPADPAAPIPEPAATARTPAAPPPQTSITTSPGLPAPPVPPPHNAPPAGAPVTAIVTGHVVADRRGTVLPVVTLTPPGSSLPQSFVVQFSANNLLTGAIVTLLPQVPGAGTQPAVAAAAATPAPSISETALLANLVNAPDWSTLDQMETATQTAMAVAPAADAEAAAPANIIRLLPSPAAPGNLPPAALLFVAAARAGDVEGWLGDRTIDALRRAGKAETLLKLLARDFAGLARLDTPAAPGDWRTLPLPLNWQGEIHKLILHYRQDRSGGDDEDATAIRSTRFVFDMNLTRLGAVQLDGLHRPGAGEQRLDLIVRTHASLSAQMQAAMRRTYLGALESCGHTGEITFQYRAEQWVRP